MIEDDVAMPLSFPVAPPELTCHAVLQVDGSLGDSLRKGTPRLPAASREGRRRTM